MKKKPLSIVNIFIAIVIHPVVTIGQIKNYKIYDLIQYKFYIIKLSLMNYSKWWYFETISMQIDVDKNQNSSIIEKDAVCSKIYQSNLIA